jgi:hypothetical protein
MYESALVQLSKYMDSIFGLSFLKKPDVGVHEFDRIIMFHRGNVEEAIVRWLREKIEPGESMEIEL